MDPAKRLALVKALSVAKSFDPNLETGSRDWFVETVIKGFEAAGNTDAQIEQKTKDLIAATKTIVAAERDFALALSADGNKRYTTKLLANMRPHRVEILYGAIALEPRLADPAHKYYRLFLAKRRLRAVCRQYIWVNPNSLDPKTQVGYFHYPDDCPGNDEWRPNEDAAATFWNKKPYPTNTPFTLKPAGVADPVAAIEKLFVKKVPCKANLVDCALVADITFLDALLEAQNPKQLLQAMPADYLELTPLYKAAFMDREGETENPVDRIPLPMPPRDLQVGDQAYIFNHPLYRTFRPTGNWRGEWAFVYRARNRDYKSQQGFIFGGHGMEGTLFKFYQNFVDELSSHLALARQLALVHLTFMRGGAAAIAPGTVITDIEDDVAIYDAVAKKFNAASRHRLLAYDATAVARNFAKVPTKTKKKPKTVRAGFLIIHSKTEHAFYLAKIDKPNNNKPLSENLKKAVADLPAPRKVQYPIKIARMSAPAAGASASDIYAMANWGISYFDQGTNTQKIWPFLEVVNGKLKRKELAKGTGEPIDELFDAPFAPFTKGGTKIRVFQPRVDFGSHRGFLAANGGW